MTRATVSSAVSRIALAALVLAATIVGSAAPAVAADSICPIPTRVTPPVLQRVVGVGDASSCTEAALRRAVLAGGAIKFACGATPVTIRINAVLPVTRPTVLDGGGLVTLDGHGATRLLDLEDHTTLSVRRMTLVGAAAKRGDPDGGAGGAISGGYHVRVEVIGSTLSRNTSVRGGGAVYVGNDSRLTIVNSRFATNSAPLGGAVYSQLSTLAVSGSTFTGNRATSDSGGAILTDGAALREASTGGSISLCRTVVSSNTASGQGGGAFLWGYQKDRILLYRTTFARNVATAGGGGLGGGARIGIAQEGGLSRSGSVVLSRVAFLKNRSDANGGGIYIDCAPGCAIRNATFSRNRAANYGGAIAGNGHRDNGVTFVKNRAKAGGALAGSGLKLRNVVFSGNTATESGYQSCIDTNPGTQVLQWGSGGRDSSTPCSMGAIQADPRLLPVAQNGGGVATAMPAAGSAALGRGVDCLAKDARSVTRPVACDLGAVERKR